MVTIRLTYIPHDPTHTDIQRYVQIRDSLSYLTNLNHFFFRYCYRCCIATQKIVIVFLCHFELDWCFIITVYSLLLGASPS